MKSLENGESCTTGSFTICTHHQILLGSSNKGECGGQSMWHVHRGEGRTVCGVLVGTPEGNKPLGRPRSRWEDGLKMDLREIRLGCVEWIQLAWDKDHCRALVYAVMNLWVLAPHS
jgi:hypothetical protein